MIKYGIDCVNKYAEVFSGRVALVTAPSGRSRNNISSIDIMKEACDLRLLLSPEHGVRGDRAAGAVFDGGTDEESGLPMQSLYTKTSKHLTEQTLTSFDTLVYDIQDVGCRYYTFISTLKNVMEDCAAAGKRLVVLDRPNPLGRGVEGCLLEEDVSSFVGCYTLPVRYGMTCGEFACMVNREEKLGCDLHVIPCENMTGEELFSQTGLLWVMPSLAMPRFETALMYPGTCLIEGTNFSEGRGTADPFAIIGAPCVRAEALTSAFEALACPGVTATPVYFTPTSSKHMGELCGGIHLHITDAHALHPVEMGLRLLGLLADMYPGDFAFLPPVREDGKPFISLLMGNRALEKRNWQADELILQGQRDAAAFKVRRRPYLLYGKDNA